MDKLSVLDRQVWSMLHGKFAQLASGNESAVRIDPRYGPFAAARDTSEESQAALAALLDGSGDSLWLIETKEWPAPPNVRVERTGELLQMVADQEFLTDANDPEVVPLNEADVPEMARIALATKPGPWRELTHRMGQFYGIKIDGRLAAMAGERMLPSAGLAEVSGVCTWPEYRGRGFARRLIKRVMAEQRRRGVTPYLHSYADNEGAIGLYKSLGFRPRRTLIASTLIKAG